MESIQEDRKMPLHPYAALRAPAKKERKKGTREIEVRSSVVRRPTSSSTNLLSLPQLPKLPPHSQISRELEQKHRIRLEIVLLGRQSILLNFELSGLLELVVRPVENVVVGREAGLEG